jgi:prophage regulatory protein
MKLEKEIAAVAVRRLLRLSEVKHQVGLGRSAIYAQIREGLFPPPVKLGARAVAWPSDAIEAWIDARIVAGRTDVSDRGSRE